MFEHQQQVARHAELSMSGSRPTLLLLPLVQYNHSTWRGHALRVEVAKAHYLLRLQQEWDEAKQRELDFGAGKGKRTRSSSSVAGAVGEADDDYWEPWDGIPRPLDISQPMVLLLARKRKKNKVSPCLRASQHSTYHKRVRISCHRSNHAIMKFMHPGRFHVSSREHCGCSH